MKFKTIFSSILALSISCTAFCSETKEKADIDKVSQAFGHLIAKNIESLGLDFNTTKVIQGIQDSLDGKESPMSESECIQAITQIQEEAFQKQSTENLAKAEEFLEKNAKEKNVVELEKGKLQYKIEKEGKGEIVKEDFSPVIRYKGTFLDNSVFGASKEDETISLKETIPGFSKGIVGMKEGEKRTIYVHPEFGYGTNGYLPPNSLLTFEIECVKANAPAADESVAQSEDQEELDNFLNSQEEKAVR